MRSKTIRRLIIAGVLFGAICAAGVHRGKAQMKSEVTTVALTARMPGGVSVQWVSLPGTQFVQDSGLRADLVVIDTTWHIGLGQNVGARCRLMGRDPGEAGIFVLKKVGEAPDPAVYGFLSRPPPTQVSLLKELQPQRGRQMRTDGLLLVGTDTPTHKERVLLMTVTAL